MKMVPLLAEVDVPGALTKGTNKVPGFLVKDTLWIVGGVILLVALLVGWAVFIRRPDHDRDRVYPTKKEASEGASDSGRRRKKKRERRREHRARNPTLAETGGLPPVREDDPENSGPPSPRAV